MLFSHHMAVTVNTLTTASINNISFVPMPVNSLSFIFNPQIKIILSRPLLITVHILSKKSTTNVHDMLLTYYAHTTDMIKYKIYFLWQTHSSVISQMSLLE